MQNPLSFIGIVTHTVTRVKRHKGINPFCWLSYSKKAGLSNKKFPYISIYIELFKEGRFEYGHFNFPTHWLDTKLV